MMIEVLVGVLVVILWLVNDGVFGDDGVVIVVVVYGGDFVVNLLCFGWGSGEQWVGDEGGGKCVENEFFYG